VKFNEIYGAYWQKVFRLCMGYVNNADWAKDIAQDTFVVVLQELPKFRNEASVGTWIYRIATNQCLRQVEKEKKWTKTEVNINMPEVELPDIEKRTSYLYHCITELPEIERIIISLELEDIKQAEIATIVGISEANVRVKIHRIKERLTKKFETYEH
jgi:RNA polymerase sigma-70 factor (ECF subfamily)